MPRRARVHPVQPPKKSFGAQTTTATTDLDDNDEDRFELERELVGIDIGIGIGLVGDASLRTLDINHPNKKYTHSYALSPRAASLRFLSVRVCASC